MNAQDRITQQDNEQMEELIHAAKEALDRVVATGERYTAAPTDERYELWIQAQHDYLQAAIKCSQTIASLWRAGYRLTR